MNNLLKQCLLISKQAGQAILDMSLSRDLDTQKKVDKTPVTLADLRANEIICESLSRLAPEIPIISEEMVAPIFAKRSSFSTCWLVDPLDGTRGFIDGSDEYTVNIALIKDHDPVLGVIYAPCSDKLYYAVKNQGAFLCVNQKTQPLHVRPFNNDRPLVIAVSQYHNSPWLDELLKVSVAHQLLRLNSSIKMGYIAAGLVDFYPRLGPTSEWDTAAGQCVLEEAGGLLIDLAGNALCYNARDTLINPGFVAIGDPRQADYFLEILREIRQYSPHSRG